MIRSAIRAAAAAALIMAASALTAPAQTPSAQTWPTGNVRLIVPYAAGGTGDIVARLIAEKLGPALGHNVVVENRPGATGSIGMQMVVTAAPDGHTLLVGQTGEAAINQHWMKGLTYDPVKDLQPVALASVVPLALVVPASAPYSTLPDFITALGSGKPMTFASAGTGTPGHFAGEVLKLKTKGNLTHVPYKGAGPALNDLLGGHVDFYFPGFPASVPHVASGKLKLIAVSSGKRSGAAPNVPSVAEGPGMAGFDYTLWQGLFAPRDTPKHVVARLHAEINKVLADAQTKQKLMDAGADVNPMSVEQFAAFVKQESEKYATIIRETGVKPE